MLENAQVIQQAKIVEIAEGEKGYLVRLDNGESYKVGKKALWGWGRMQEGRKTFDQHVKTIYEELVKEAGFDLSDVPKAAQINLKRMASARAFGEVYAGLPNLEDAQRPFQAIVKTKKDGSKALLSVASFKHVLVDPARVKEIGENVFSSLGVEPWFKHPSVIRADQLLGVYGESNGLNLGLSFSSGNIYTQHAINISQMIELQICTNPLVWIRDMLSTYIARSEAEAHSRLEWRTRILRLEGIKDEKVLEQRLVATVRDVQSGEKGLLAIIRGSKKKLLDGDQAETILKAFSSSYGIGARVQGEILNDYQESNGKSLYDLAQSTSLMAWNSSKMREDATRARSTLTGIAAVLTTIRDVPGTYKLCKQRLEAKAVS